MNKRSKHIVIIAGEASGDMHAAHLVEELKKLDPSLSFSGLGGSKMAASGVEIYEDLTQIAVVGFIEVAKYYKEFKKHFKFILKKIKEIKPAAVVLVDYPGFNLRLAKSIKKLRLKNTKVVYYISPQVWAWKANRVKLVKKFVDRMLVLFSFEKEFYAKRKLDVAFVGHPLMDSVKVKIPRETFLKSIGYNHLAYTIGLLPGSRLKEIDLHLPIMLKAAEILNKTFPKTQFLIIRAPTIDKGYLVKKIIDSKLKIKIIDQNSYDGINACDTCLVSSGTATLELAILQKPMVIVYKTSLLTYLIAKILVRIKYIGLVNIIAGKEIVPELVQFGATPKDLADKTQEIITNEIKIAEMKEELRKVKESLGEPGASYRAAKEILRVI